ncbi:phosphoenolpyruvate-protein phosphotransferase [Vibrio maritimus]|uniref:Phosphoenolpyruvate-protein phosphotransferase n=3 Tax=Vibrio TaxID=662 RepID=A0A090RVZ9_9VIBR|nr:phosphoenolpyruvate-protein phosphotransferase [Vibrio maritimus]
MLYILPFMAERVDFVSVGTNDLTQYLLAVDRNNAQVADIYETLHPSVLAAMKHIFETCQSYHLPVCICGELAGDPIGALLLVGLGYDTLSMNTSNVAKVKYLLQQSSLDELKQLADKALMQPYGKTIYNQMREYFENKGLAGFIRAGKF